MQAHTHVHTHTHTHTQTHKHMHIYTHTRTLTCMDTPLALKDEHPKVTSFCQKADLASNSNQGGCTSPHIRTCTASNMIQ